jgi:hypothetical protein
MVISPTLQLNTSLTLRRFFRLTKTSFMFLLKAYNMKMVVSLLMAPYVTFSLLMASLMASTLPQNGKAERMIHTTNDIARTLLLQANLTPPFRCSKKITCFWVEALHTATHLLN